MLVLVSVFTDDVSTGILSFKVLNSLVFSLKVLIPLFSVFIDSFNVFEPLLILSSPLSNPL